MVWIAIVPIAIALLSVLHDFVTYESRQTRWEMEHPGEFYIRNYRKLSKR